MDYAVCEIAGKQVIITPGTEITVPYLGEITEFESDKIMLISKRDKVSIGAPFLQEKLKFKVTGDAAKKTRVTFYKPKANHRKVTGHRIQYSKLRLAK